MRIKMAKTLCYWSGCRSDALENKFLNAFHYKSVHFFYTKIVTI
jgi:hypothetical protein